MTIRSARGHVRAYRRLRVLLVAFFGGYSLLAAVLLVGFRRTEIFPVFAFNLFAKVPNVIERGPILIHEVDGERFDPPRPIDDVSGRFTQRPETSKLGVVSKYLRAERAGNREAQVELRRVLEENWLRSKERVRYELVFQRYDPIELWREGRVLERRSLGVFERDFRR